MDIGIVTFTITTIIVVVIGSTIPEVSRSHLRWAGAQDCAMRHAPGPT